MKINEIRVYRVDLPIAGAGYKMSRSRMVTHTESIILEVRTDNELSGWGEVCPFGSNYLPAFSGGAFAAMKELAPILIGQDPRNLDGINQLMDRTLFGHLYAKSGFDIACWDLLGKAANQPLYILLGGLLNRGPVVRTGVTSVGHASIAQQVKEKRDQGFKVFSLKVGDDYLDDAEVTREVMSEIKPGERVVADPNGGWLLYEALEFADRVTDLKGLMIEQPCESLNECLAVARSTSLPIVFDECIDSLDSLARLLVDKQVSVVNLKIERIGGISRTRQMRDLCSKLGCAMFLQEVGGAEITHAATTHLAHSLDPRLLIGATTIKVAKSTAIGGPRVAEGKVYCGDQPGLGVEPIRSVLGDPVMTFR